MRHTQHLVPLKPKKRQKKEPCLHPYIHYVGNIANRAGRRTGSWKCGSCPRIFREGERTASGWRISGTTLTRT